MTLSSVPPNKPGVALTGAGQSTGSDELKLPGFITPEEYHAASPFLQSIISTTILNNPNASEDLIAGIYYQVLSYRIPPEIAAIHSSHRSEVMVGTRLTKASDEFRSKFKLEDNVKLSDKEYEEMGKVWFTSSRNDRARLISYSERCLFSEKYETPAFLLT